MGSFKELTYRFSYKFLLVVLFILALGLFSRRVDTFDLWWNLASGRYIFKHKSFIYNDPFDFTSFPPYDAIPAKALFGKKISKSLLKANLSHSWLSQVLYYKGLSLGGLKGLGWIKSLIMTLVLLPLFFRMKKRNISRFLILASLFWAIMIMRFFDYNRPQIFSFLFTSLILLILETLPSNNRNKFLIIPVMLLWANLHGGFILGVVILGTYLLCICLRHYLNFFGQDPYKESGFLITIILLIGGIIASAINPNGLKLIGLFLKGQKILYTPIIIEEYEPPRLYEYHTYWLLLLATILVIPFILHKISLENLAILALLAFYSLKGIRYIPFFAIAAIPVAAEGIHAIWIRQVGNRTLKYMDILYALFAICLCFTILYESLNKKLFTLNFQRRDYPVEAVEFLKEKKFEGNLFNIYEWGGYLIWKLYPQYKVFIDGRSLNPDVIYNYKAIINGSQNKILNKEEWQYLLEAYNIQIILIKTMSRNGVLIPLVDRLYGNSSWSLVYTDGHAVIYLRKNGLNKDLCKNLTLPKDAIYDEILKECEEGMKYYPATAGFYEIAGHIYMKRFQFDKAINAYKHYLAINPNNAYVKKMLKLARVFLLKRGHLKGHPPMHK